MLSAEDGSEEVILYPKKIEKYIKFGEYDGSMTPYIDDKDMFENKIMEYLEENGSIDLVTAKDIQEEIKNCDYKLVDISEDLVQ